MLRLKASEWGLVKGRGVIASIPNLPDEFYEKYWNPTQLTNKQVEIDGTVYTVTGVETFAIPRSKERPYRGACGLLVIES